MQQPPPPTNAGQPQQPPFPGSPRGVHLHHAAQPHHIHTGHGGPPTVSAQTGVVSQGGTGVVQQPPPTSVVTSGQTQQTPKVHVLYFPDPNAGGASPVFVHQAAPNMVHICVFYEVKNRRPFFGCNRIVIM